MKKPVINPHVIKSITELHRFLGLAKPDHPLVSFINMSDLNGCDLDTAIARSFAYDFYSICIKKDFKGKMKYGQQYYDFDEGVMTFFSPGQVLAVEPGEDTSVSGYWLVVHQDFIQNYPLAKKIKEYGFFSYAVNEALHMSDKEELMVASIMQNIQQEYHYATDAYSQDVMISHIELLLNYANRFYNRQFITRKQANPDLLIKVEHLLSDYFNSDKVQTLGLPTVQYLSDQLNLSPSYLSDMLRALTGQSTQQHIHNKLIDQAKDLISTTSLSVAEIAYRLGFEYPQSFSKLFKTKTQVSPLEFRHSFN